MSVPEAASVSGVLKRRGLVLVAKRVPGGDLGGKWEFPGGKVEPGESPEEALVREFLEELQLDIQVGDFLGEGGFIHRGKKVRLLVYFVSSESEPIHGVDHTELRWVTWEELQDLDLAPSDKQALSWIGQRLGF